MKFNRKTLSIAFIVMLIIISVISIWIVYSNEKNESSLSNEIITPTNIITTKPTKISELIDPNTTKNIPIYFSKSPESDDDPTYASTVSRTTNRIDIVIYAVEQVIAGPSQEEKSRGFYSDLVLSGESDCEGQDFTFIINPKKQAIIRFCKEFKSPGVMADGRVLNTFRKTLLEFPHINDVTLITRNGRCLEDLSGDDGCLRE